TIMEVDGKVYAPYRLGQTTAGTPTIVSRQVMDFFARLDPWRKNFEARLASALNIDGLSQRQLQYWTPHVDTTVPGFEEWAGFAASDYDSVFVRVARLV
ncbi:MAG: hypothetical protein M3022_10345, partial [Actinomycetota bacterium]|nr:hypothetical protein [Actinomycetota bacterium]